MTSKVRLIQDSVYNSYATKNTRQKKRNYIDPIHQTFCSKKEFTFNRVSFEKFQFPELALPFRGNKDQNRSEV